MNRPSPVSRSKVSVSDFTLTPRSRSSPMAVRTCGQAAPPAGLPEHERVGGLQGRQGSGEPGPLHAALAGFGLGEQPVIPVGVQGVEL